MISTADFATMWKALETLSDDACKLALADALAEEGVQPDEEVALRFAVKHGWWPARNHDHWWAWTDENRIHDEFYGLFGLVHGDFQQKNCGCQSEDLQPLLARVGKAIRQLGIT